MGGGYGSMVTVRLPNGSRKEARNEAIDFFEFMQLNERYRTSGSLV